MKTDRNSFVVISSEELNKRASIALKNIYNFREKHEDSFDYSHLIGTKYTEIKYSWKWPLVSVKKKVIKTVEEAKNYSIRNYNLWDKNNYELKIQRIRDVRNYRIGVLTYLIDTSNAVKDTTVHLMSDHAIILNDCEELYKEFQED
jgi:hypothetical protein